MSRAESFAALMARYVTASTCRACGRSPALCIPSCALYPPTCGRDPWNLCILSLRDLPIKSHIRQLQSSKFHPSLPPSLSPPLPQGQAGPSASSRPSILYYAGSSGSEAQGSHTPEIQPLRPPAPAAPLPSPPPAASYQAAGSSDPPVARLISLSGSSAASPSPGPARLLPSNLGSQYDLIAVSNCQPNTKHGLPTAPPTIALHLIRPLMNAMCSAGGCSATTTTTASAHPTRRRWRWQRSSRPALSPRRTGLRGRDA